MNNTQLSPLEGGARKYTYVAGWVLGTDEVLVSAYRHHFVKSSEFPERFVDGGQTDYFRCSEGIAQIFIESDCSPVDLLEKGISHFLLEDVKIVEKREDVDSFEYKRKHAKWGSRGENGDQPLKYQMLEDLETNHLENILKNCSHISIEYKKFIWSILSNRNS